jgi:tripartite motif-containing protein 71
MLKIGERELTVKEMVAAGVVLLVAATLVWWMVGIGKPSPVVLAPPAQPGMVLLQGGQVGSNQGQFQYPRGIAIDSHNDIYVADSRNHRIQKISGSNGKFIMAFGGLANVGGGDVKKITTTFTGKLNEPNGVAIGPGDDVYVIDTWNGRVEVFTSKGKYKTGYTTEDGFWGPREIVVNRGEGSGKYTGTSYVADTGKHRIVQFDANGKKVRAWGALDMKTGQAIKGDKEGEFNEPIGLALDKDGNLYVADRLNFRIQVFTPDGHFIKQWPVDGWSKDQIDMEPHLALDQAHSLLYVTDGRGKKVYCYDLDGKKVATLDKSVNGDLFVVPIGVAVDKDGFVYVVDAANAKIMKFKGQF